MDLMSGAYSYDESLNLAKKDYAKNFKEALQDFCRKNKESPNDLNAMNETFNNLETELERYRKFEPKNSTHLRAV